MAMISSRALLKVSTPSSGKTLGLTSAGDGIDLMILAESGVVPSLMSLHLACKIP